jgi:transmembrane sensor
MVSPTERLTGMAKHVAPDWTPERERAVRDRLGRAIVRRKRRHVIATAATAFLFIVGALLFWSRAVGPVRNPGTIAARNVVLPPLLRFEDGSIVTAASPDGRAEPVEVSPELVSTRLTSGAARFSVTPNPKRVFRVTARDVTVTVLGTIFTVAIEPNAVRVHVERGRVRVGWPAGEHELALNEEVVVPTSDGVARQETEVRQGQKPAPAPAIDETEGANPGEKVAAENAPTPAVRHNPEKVHPVASWRELAQDGDYANAFARMSSEGPSAVRDEPGDLLLAADVARLGGHPEKAVAPLSAVVATHTRDSRAPLAAFTLGRTLLDQLGRPREAAEAFAAARRFDPRGALAQDALAREVESWSRAGEATLAHQRATEYVTRYPKGRRLAAVKRLGGLPESPSE